MDSDPEEEEAENSSQKVSETAEQEAVEPWQAFMRAFPPDDLIFHIPGADVT